MTGYSTRQVGLRACTLLFAKGLAEQPRAQPASFPVSRSTCGQTGICTALQQCVHYELSCSMTPTEAAAAETRDKNMLDTETQRPGGVDSLRSGVYSGEHGCLPCPRLKLWRRSAGAT